VALVGGGSYPQPGNRWHGVLFLDELPEFKRDVQVMRQPLEDRVTISREVYGDLSFIVYSSQYESESEWLF
jgi:predicted ATPase with chaperone activity